MRIRALLGSALAGCSAVAAVVVPACGADERIGGAPSLPVHDAAARDVVVDGAGPLDGGGHDTGAKIRDVFRRNPFGNVEAFDNLLWDGDFEWHSPFAQQYGWAFVGAFLNPVGFDQVKVGAECRSGMKCGYLAQNQRVAAVGVSPTGAMVSASVWGRVPTDLCHDLAVRLFACDYGTDPDVALVPEADAPAADGWCRFSVVTAVRERATCLYVEARFPEGEAVIDDAVVSGVPAGARVVPSPTRPLSAPDRAALAAARASLRRQFAPAIHPPNDAQRALERWARGRR